jgi:hypothetical protein
MHTSPKINGRPIAVLRLNSYVCSLPRTFVINYCFNMKTLKLSTISFCLLSFVLFSCQKTAPTGQKKPPVVTAGPSQAIILPLDSVTLAGKAVDSSSTIVAYLWSEVSGPNVPVI